VDDVSEASAQTNLKLRKESAVVRLAIEMVRGFVDIVGLDW
jgi:hypothetical protein